MDELHQALLDLWYAEPRSEKYFAALHLSRALFDEFDIDDDRRAEMIMEIAEKSNNPPSYPFGTSRE